ncbi:hypothetical protein SAMD00023353_0700850 [Rosellinia necatrix]|uniref:Uncharacterized protein n=1 Tax=Rosellinia necatrix TaxID=77044 RepID=A0A1S8A645_ROSNE|nr:hypothetical protein SAMD00023353_0700850 [Rosellinia necatrix]
MKSRILLIDSSLAKATFVSGRKTASASRNPAQQVASRRMGEGRVRVTSHNPTSRHPWLATRWLHPRRTYTTRILVHLAAGHDM